MSQKTATKSRAIEDMTTAEVAREIRRTMARLAKLQAVLVEWSGNAEGFLALDTVTVQAAEEPQA